MSKERFADSAVYDGPQRFYPRKAAIADAAATILDEYAQARRLPITLRALWYQMVARGHLTNNGQDAGSFYGTLKDARNLGLIDWDDLYEEGRSTHQFGAMTSAAEAIEPDRYQVDRWIGQPHRPEVWVEKAAQLGTLQRVCARWRVPYLAGEGFMSTGAAKQAGDRMLGYRELGQDPVVLYLGDHDPSGLWMDEDIKRRLAVYTHDDPPTFTRLGLTWKQAQGLPPNLTDPDRDRSLNSHLRAYEARFGRGAPQWEMDALPPDQVESLIETAVEALIKDVDAWNGQADAEADGRATLQRAKNDVSGDEAP